MPGGLVFKLKKTKGAIILTPDVIIIEFIQNETLSNFSFEMSHF